MVFEDESCVIPYQKTPKICFRFIRYIEILAKIVTLVFIKSYNTPWIKPASSYILHYQLSEFGDENWVVYIE